MPGGLLEPDRLLLLGYYRPVLARPDPDSALRKVRAPPPPTIMIIVVIMIIMATTVIMIIMFIMIIMAILASW